MKPSAAITIHTIGKSDGDYECKGHLFLFSLRSHHADRLHWNDNRPLKMRLQCDCHLMKRGNRLSHCRQVKSLACPLQNHVRHQRTKQTLCKCSLSRIPAVCEIRLDNLTEIHFAMTTFQTIPRHPHPLVAYRRVQSICSHIYFLIESVRCWIWFCDAVIWICWGPSNNVVQHLALLSPFQVR